MRNIKISISSFLFFLLMSAPWLSAGIFRTLPPVDQPSITADPKKYTAFLAQLGLIDKGKNDSFLDWNGDGRIDFFTNNLFGNFVFLSTVDRRPDGDRLTFVKKTITFPGDVYAYHWWVDWDGDERSDLIMMERKLTEFKTVFSFWKNNGSDIVWAGSFTVDDLEVAEPGFEIWKDYNGDGLPDYIGRFKRSDGVLEWRVYLNKKNFTFEKILLNIPDPGYSDSSRVWRDFDGDGKLDYACLGGDSPDFKLILYKNTGWGFSHDVAGAGFFGIGGKHPEDSPISRWIDFNGDGRPDYVKLAPTTGRFIIYIFNGNGFDSVETQVYNAHWLTFQNSYPGPFGFQFFGDVNGDRKDDFIWIEQGPYNVYCKYILSTGATLQGVGAIMFQRDHFRTPLTVGDPMTYPYLNDAMTPIDLTGDGRVELFYMPVFPGQSPTDWSGEPYLRPALPGWQARVQNIFGTVFDPVIIPWN